MADGLTDIQSRILQRDKAGVRALLGRPVTTYAWKATAPRPGADAAEQTAYSATTLDEIWVYPNGRVHFALAGTAIKVDNKAHLHLTPPQNIA